MAGEHYRPIDIARQVNSNVQLVRRYEAYGFLPPSERSLGGHRLYTSRHLHAMQVARAMIPAYGWAGTLRIMHAVNSGDVAKALPLVDERHAELDRARRQTGETLKALGTVAAAEDAVGSTKGRRTSRLTIGEAAGTVGVRVSALRFWEQQGLLQPERNPESGYRLYDAEQLRKLQVVTLLRSAGGYDFDAIRSVLGELGAGRPERAMAAVERRREQLMEMSRCCLKADAALWSYIREASMPEARRADAASL